MHSPGFQTSTEFKVLSSVLLKSQFVFFLCFPGIFASRDYTPSKDSWEAASLVPRFLMFQSRVSSRVRSGTQAFYFS